VFSADQLEVLLCATRMAAHLNRYINTTNKDNKYIKPRVYIRGAIIWDTAALLEAIRTRLAEDTFAQGIIRRLQDNEVGKTKKHSAVSKAHVDQWELQNGLLFHSGACYVPDVADLRLRILQQVHNHLSRLGLRPDTSSSELRSCSTLGAYLQDKFNLPASL
jgi:hypothetical protein